MTDPTFLQCMISGAVAGLSVDVALYPIDTLKTRLQSPGGFQAAGGSAVVSVAWLRASDAAGHPTAVVVTAAGEVKFWAAPSFSSLPSAKVGCARAESAELVDAGARGATCGG